MCLVLLGHLSGTRGFGTLDLGIGDYAHLGVVVFFVISGYLITNLLRAEESKLGAVSLARFYSRRALRLFPAAYAYILCIAAMAGFGWISLRPDDVLYAATYTANHLPYRSWYVGHLWSLSVEEQFYLVWPMAFALLGGRRAVCVAVAMILLGPSARIFNRVALLGTPYHDLPMFPMVADSLATGCLLASAAPFLETQWLYRQLFRPACSIGLLCLVLLVNRYSEYTAVSVFGTVLLDLCVAVLLHRCVYHHRDGIGRLLNWTPLAFVGTLSYSLYLWQQIFLNRQSEAWINAFPQNILLAIGVAVASYYALEKPLLQLRHRLRTTGG